MQVSNLEEHLLVCHRADTALLLSTSINAKQNYISEHISIYVVDIDLQKLREMLSLFPEFNIRQYLDKFYIWTCENDLKKHQEVLDGFFQFIANEYESLVDIQRNIDNINNLLIALVELLTSPQESFVVDYGCGTGISVIPASSFHIKLIGVDRCPNMRQIAASKGMRVWGIGELAKQPKNSVDGAFASYVFHLLPDTQNLKLLWSRIKVGGVLVANFHKNKGIKLVSNCIKELNGSIIQTRKLKRHGMYIAYRKNS